MPKPAGDSAETLRHQIAVNAARLIAQDGLDYGSAKRKAAHDILGKRRIPADLLPANEAVEDEVRVYQDLFQSHVQPRRLAELRGLAVELMRFFAKFQPYLTGAVLTGSAGAYSDVHLEVYVDSAKDVELTLLNCGICFEVHPADRSDREVEERLSFEWRGSDRSRRETVHMTIFLRDALRGALAGQRSRARADLAAVEYLLAHADEAEEEK